MDIADNSSSTLSSEEKETNKRYRYLKLEPGVGDAPVTCTITHESFSVSQHLAEKGLSCPEYWALSYTWGSPSPQRWIEVDGQILDIRDNLWRFLRRVRHQTSSRTLWVDAVCINQDDPVEKTGQVAIMGSIFRCADDVLAWIGEEADDSAFVMNLARSSKKLKPNIILAQHHCAAERLRTWQALKAFLGRPYWTRTWIMQEVVLAKNPVIVFCGTDVVDYESLYGMVQILDMALQDIPYIRDMCTSSRKKRELDSILDLATEFRKDKLPDLLTYGTDRASPGSLITLIDRYAHTECSDPRDKVFALLEMAADIDLIKAPSWFDYSKDVHEVFFEVLAHCATACEAGADFGKLLMQNMRLTPESLRRYIASNDVDQSIAEASLRNTLTLRLPFNFERRHNRSMLSPPKVTCVRYGAETNNGYVLVFEADQGKDDTFSVAPLRGIAYDVQCGDRLYIEKRSDVALITRGHDDHSFAIGWALAPIGRDWHPDARLLERLTYLRQQPFENSVDLSRTTPPEFTDCLFLGLSLPVVVTVIEGVTIDKGILPISRIRAYVEKHSSPSQSVHWVFKNKRSEWTMSLFWHFNVLHNINQSYKESRGSLSFSPTVTIGMIGRYAVVHVAKQLFHGGSSRQVDIPDPTVTYV
ncbi:hypothetical protein LTS07_006896 [Exophiala sideris]|uniref:Heterokaryon incompatibility domain-containing protein n=1 Tax=Exophiala sideris TaxID=1016849 RepID=A0ABR0J4A7_9EURO|nr:hypothetical protein LTS07_006896 [Exophiala sideris]KAK5035003.1 Folylpolyglutamate synthetase [Exophiala sideris]KAK5056263.1 hypothetical protein LTR69_007803 [Exophiala sideris]KAK5181248.1 hypothetical protein LTR44_006580 [Eurotiomycetes sp. CCFEE 6388]